MEVNPCLRIQHHPLLSALWSWGLYNLFVPSLSIAGSTTQSHQEITRSGGEESYLLHLESRWLLSWPLLARRERGRLFIFAKGWETWMSEAMPCMSNTALGLEGRAGFLLTTKSARQISVLLSTHSLLAKQWTTALTKLGISSCERGPSWSIHTWWHFTAVQV